MSINWQNVFTTLTGNAVLLAAATWLIQRLVSDRLTVATERVKIEIKARADTELERLRHLLSSRISRIHEKEFEVLPKAWFLLHDAYGLAFTITSRLRFYPDFARLPEPQFEEFLQGTPLTPYQRRALRATPAPDRRAYYTRAMEGINLDHAQEKQRKFHNYLVEHRIFLTDELRLKFGAVDEILFDALTEYDIGRNTEAPEMQTSASEKIAQLEERISEVERAVQERLHYPKA